MIKSHKDLTVWRRSLNLAKEVYGLTEFFPKYELYGLTSQMKRAAISIPSNIAEGYNRRGRKEYCQSCFVAFGSANELETQLLLAKDLAFAPATAFEKAESELEIILRMLNRLCTALQT